MFEMMHDGIQHLNQSKYFLGFIIILLNLGSKFITLGLNNYHKQILIDTVGREVMIFAICFVGTRDILVALAMSSLFIILNEYLFNETSTFCIIPKNQRASMKASMDINHDGIIDESEIKRAIEILNRANKQKQQDVQRNAYMTFMNNV
jgi:hypothetical protein